MNNDFHEAQNGIYQSSSQINTYGIGLYLLDVDQSNQCSFEASHLSSKKCDCIYGDFAVYIRKFSKGFKSLEEALATTTKENSRKKQVCKLQIDGDESWSLPHWDKATHPTLFEFPTKNDNYQNQFISIINHKDFNSKHATLTPVFKKLPHSLSREKIDEKNQVLDHVRIQSDRYIPTLNNNQHNLQFHLELGELFSNNDMSQNVICHMDSRSGIALQFPSQINQTNLHIQFEKLHLSASVDNFERRFIPYSTSIIDFDSSINNLEISFPKKDTLPNLSSNMTWLNSHTPLPSIISSKIIFNLTFSNLLEHGKQIDTWENRSFLSGVNSYNIIIAVCVNLAAVCIDLSFPSENVRDRFIALVMLLLCAMLENNNLFAISSSSQMNFEKTFVTTAIFFTILISIARTATLKLIPKRKTRMMMDSFTRLASMCSFISLLLNICFSVLDHTDLDHFSLSKFFKWFGITFFIQFQWNFFRFRQKRRRRRSIEMSLSSSLYMSGTNQINEQNWYEWDSEKFLWWVSSKMDETIQDHIKRTLAPENIDGKCLDYLTLSDLRSFGLSYGDAIFIMNEIHKLKSIHDGGVYRRNDQRYMHYRCNQTAVIDGEEINPGFEMTNDHSRMENKEKKNESIGDDIQMSDEILSKAKDIMSERFGIALPEMSISESVPETESHESKRESIKVSSRSRSTGKQTNAPNERSDSIEDGLSTSRSMLNSMPSHVQEIARRRPDLFKQVMTSKVEKFSDGNKTQFYQVPTSEKKTHVESKKEVKNIFLSETSSQTITKSTIDDVLSNRVIESMPPNIKEIVMRRPDLVQQLISSKVKNNKENS